MPTLYLHIGAPKTGSTYIQSSLRMSRERLSSEGLVYPEGTENPGLGPESLTRGNGYRILHRERVFERAMKAGSVAGRRGVIISNEDMWFELQKDRFRQVVFRTSRKLGFERVKILLFLRNPIEFSVSLWLQGVKTSGNSKEMEASLTDFNASRLYRGGIGLFEDVLQHEGVELSVLNYSVVKRELIAEVARWLEVPGDVLATASSMQVNRSLDVSEARLQIELNRILGPGAAFLSKALIERITDIQPKSPAPSLKCQEAVWEQSKPWIERLNRHMPEGQEMVFDRMVPTPVPEGYRFTEQQIKIIAEALGGEIKRIWDRETSAMAFLRRLKERLRQYT